MVLWILLFNSLVLVNFFIMLVMCLKYPLKSQGMADETEVSVIQKYEERIIEAIGAGEFVKAFHAFDELLNGDFYPYPTYFANITGTTNYFNFINPVYPPNPYNQYVQLPSIRNAIHVGQYAYNGYNSTVELHLKEDWMR